MVVPKAAQDHRDDILIIEMGSNGGWDNYDELIAQYQSIIDYTGCEDYIIVGDTDDPGSSLADEGVINMDNSEGGTGKNYTDWEVALRDAFGEHFFNTRVYMLEYGLSNCGLKASALDRLYAAFGCISGNFVRTGHILMHMDIMLRGLVYIRRVLNWATGNKVAS